LLRRSLGKGKVFVIGCGQYGQLGLGQRIDQLDKPALVRALDQVRAGGQSRLACDVVDGGS
jgi:alpha-tubulin suppressor-like RCC1 family protein